MKAATPASIAASISGLVALLDEYRDRPLHCAADLEHLLQLLAAWRLEIDQGDVGVEPRETSNEVRGFVQTGHVQVASLAQRVFQDRGAGSDSRRR